MCLLLDNNYIGWTGYSLGQFKIEHAEVLQVSERTMHRIIAKAPSTGASGKDKATNRVRFHSFWYSLRKRFIEEIKDKKGGKDEKEISAKIQSGAGDQLLRTAEVLSMLRISRATMRDLIFAGELSPIMIGKKSQRFSSREVGEYIEKVKGSV